MKVASFCFNLLFVRFPRLFGSRVIGIKIKNEFFCLK